MIKILCAIVLAFGFQTPPTPSLGTTPQGYTYRITDLAPRVFPLNPYISWPPIHAIYQHGIHVHGSSGAPPPDFVKFIFVMNGGYYFMPVTGVITLAPDDWLLITPTLLIPNLLPGPVSIRVMNGHTGIKSNRKAGIIG